MSEPITDPALIRRRNTVGNCPVDDDGWNCDNLAVVLASYFSNHVDRPENDEPENDECSWGKWVMEKTNRALDIIAEELFTEAKEQ